MISDRIDLKAIGLWTNLFRPSGITITFGTKVRNGDYYSLLTNVILPYGAVVGATVLSTGTLVTGGVYFDSVMQVTIPYGVRFIVPLVANEHSYPVGVYKMPPEDTFLMDTIQFIDVSGKVIFSVHDVESGETISFAKPTANISRLVMYRNGVGIPAEAFYCYSILFKISIAAADIAKFNLLHPSDLNPSISDDGSVQGAKYIIPQ
jgi:hypothetical protein